MNRPKTTSPSAEFAGGEMAAFESEAGDAVNVISL
jgi:hypothetical protein